MRFALGDALKKEKHEPTYAALVGALEACGAPTVLDEATLVKCPTKDDLVVVHGLSVCEARARVERGTPLPVSELSEVEQTEAQCTLRALLTRVTRFRAAASRVA